MTGERPRQSKQSLLNEDQQRKAVDALEKIYVMLGDESAPGEFSLIRKEMHLNAEHTNKQLVELKSDVAKIEKETNEIATTVTKAITVLAEQVRELAHKQELAAKDFQHMSASLNGNGTELTRQSNAITALEKKEVENAALRDKVGTQEKRLVEVEKTASIAMSIKVLGGLVIGALTLYGLLKGILAK